MSRGTFRDASTTCFIDRPIRHCSLPESIFLVETAPCAVCTSTHRVCKELQTSVCFEGIRATGPEESHEHVGAAAPLLNMITQYPMQSMLT